MLQLKILICMKICNVYARQGTTDWVGRGGFIFKRLREEMEQYMKNWKREMFSLKGGENEEPEIG